MKNKLFISSTAVDGKSKFYAILPEIQNYIQKYFEIEFYDTVVKTPYFINLRRRKDLKALVGKGSPEEIWLETKVWAQIKGVNLEQATAKEIRELMRHVGIGIDCSGLVVNSLLLAIPDLCRKLNYITNSPRELIARWLRPVENLNAQTLTSDRNTRKISLNKVRPGDLLRLKARRINGYHVALVTKVTTQVEPEQVSLIEYVHAHPEYGPNDGVRRGSIEIIDPSKPIWEQTWNDTYKGMNYIRQEALEDKDYTAFVRLSLDD